MTDTPSDTAISATLARLAGEASPAWAELGLVLIDIEETRYWNKTSGSLTQWIKEHALDFGLQETSLWRYRRAVRYYQRLQHAHPTWTVFQTPTPLTEQLRTLSPENLELLGKLQRAVPEERFAEIAQKMLSGAMTRTTLRKAWKAYRPALSGKTARGHREPPQVNHNDPDQAASVLYGSVLTALVASPPSWAGVDRPAAHEVFTEVHTEGREAHRRVIFDAIAVIKPDDQSALEFHGIEIVGRPSPATLSDCQPRAALVDFFWLALPENASTADLLRLETPFGLLVAKGDHLEVVRHATRNPEAIAYQGQLSYALLEAAIRR